MRLHEFEAAEIFESMGIPVPRRGVAATVQEAVHVAGEIGYPVMLKAQVLTGSRGLAGGIKTAYTAEELKEMAEGLLTSEINGLPVRMILVAEKADIAREPLRGRHRARVYGEAGHRRKHRRRSTYRRDGTESAGEDRRHPRGPHVWVLSLSGPGPAQKTRTGPAPARSFHRRHCAAL